MEKGSAAALQVQDKALHTSGPWFASGAAVYSEDPRAHKPGTPLNIVCCTGDDGDEWACREHIANACLIAAAPALLIACKLAVLRLNDGNELDSTISVHIRAAIALAEGR